MSLGSSLSIQTGASRNDVPRIAFSKPNAGWLPITVTWEGRECKMYASTTPRDTLFDFVAWMEAILVGDLPAHWTLNEEEIQFHFYAERVSKEDILLILYAPAAFEDTFDEIKERIEESFVHAVFDAQALVGSWSHSFREYLASEFDQAEWGTDLRLVDFSRLDTLLAGEI